MNNQNRPSINEANQPGDIEINPINNRNIKISPNNAQNFIDNAPNYPNHNIRNDNQEKSMNYTNSDFKKEKKEYEENLD